MSWSFQIARAFGIPIRVHLTFLLIVAWAAFSWGGRHGFHGALFGVISTLALFVSVTLHELGHVWAAGARPPGRLGRSVLAAVDEGFADYYAALVNRSPRVGGRDELRDLERPPPPAAAAWAELALAPEGFDPHRLGHGLAASLWALEPANTGLLLDLHTGLASDATYTGVPDTPGAVIEELARRIPNRSRARFEQAVAAWAPAEVLGGLASVDSARAAPGKMRGAHGP